MGQPLYEYECEFECKLDESLIVKISEYELKYEYEFSCESDEGMSVIIAVKCEFEHEREYEFVCEFLLFLRRFTAVNFFFVNGSRAFN